jgi:transposase-like protein
MEAGENVCALARELKIKRKLLYDWRDKLRRLGPAGLRGRGRPARSSVVEPLAPAATEDDAARRIAELERTIGRQQMELDFFQRALRRVGGNGRTSAGRGSVRSTRSSAS